MFMKSRKIKLLEYSTPHASGILLKFHGTPLFRIHLLILHEYSAAILLSNKEKNVIAKVSRNLSPIFVNLNIMWAIDCDLNRFFGEANNSSYSNAEQID